LLWCARRMARPNIAVEASQSTGSQNANRRVFHVRPALQVMLEAALPHQ
jgi:hypothetical protein